ncbi:MAG TPA: hypothetical protein DDZ51_26780 [Planctomycetaceae bacterium]|nr:hypothetical protein [Planctomycetaceae bacterium]
MAQQLELHRSMVLELLRSMELVLVHSMELVLVHSMVLVLEHSKLPYGLHNEHGAWRTNHHHSSFQQLAHSIQPELVLVHSSCCERLSA